MHVSPAIESRLAWKVMLLLFLGSVMNYMDRAVLGVLMPQVRGELGLTNTSYAMVVNAFLAFYMLFYVLGGRLADYLGTRRAFSLTVLVWSLAGMAHAFAAGFLSLAACRAALGAAEGGYYPAAIRAATEWFGSERRAKAIGLILSAISLGTLLTPPLVAAITLRWGWRMAFLLTGAAGLLLLPAWLMLHRRVRQLYGCADPAPASPPHTNPGSATAQAGPAPGVLRTLRNRTYLCILSARACSDSAWYFYLFWMPGYFQDARHITLDVVGRYLWIPFLASGVGALAGAWASSRLIAGGWSVDRARKSILLLAAGLASVGATACFAPGFASALALVSLALFSHQMWSTNIHTAITEITPPRHVAVLYGVTGAAGTLSGILVQSAVGPLVDAAGYTPAFVLAGSLYVLAAALLLAGGKISPLR